VDDGGGWSSAVFAVGHRPKNARSPAPLDFKPAPEHFRVGSTSIISNIKPHVCFNTLWTNNLAGLILLA